MAQKHVVVARVGEIQFGESKRVSPQRGEHILICNVGGTLYAISDVCTHDGGILGFGDLDDNIIECPRHGARFDVTTGQAVAPPAMKPVRVYPIRVKGEDVEVELDR